MGWGGAAVCTWVQMPVEAKKGIGSLQLELEWLWAAWRGHWEPNLGGLQEQTAFEPQFSPALLPFP